MISLDVQDIWWLCKPLLFCVCINHTFRHFLIQIKEWYLKEPNPRIFIFSSSSYFQGISKFHSAVSQLRETASIRVNITVLLAAVYFSHITVFVCMFVFRVVNVHVQPFYLRKKNFFCACYGQKPWFLLQLILECVIKLFRAFCALRFFVENYLNWWNCKDSSLNFYQWRHLLTSYDSCTMFDAHES